MQKQHVQSSNINSVGYNDYNQIMEIEFNLGSMYQYYDVPKHIYKSFIVTDSKGKYFHQHIKNCYKFKKIK